MTIYWVGGKSFAQRLLQIVAIRVECCLQSNRTFWMNWKWAATMKKERSRKRSDMLRINKSWAKMISMMLVGWLESSSLRLVWDNHCFSYCSFLFLSQSCVRRYGSVCSSRFGVCVWVVVIRSYTITLSFVLRFFSLTTLGLLFRVYNRCACSTSTFSVSLSCSSPTHSLRWRCCIFVFILQAPHR